MISLLNNQLDNSDLPNQVCPICKSLHIKKMEKIQMSNKDTYAKTDIDHSMTESIYFSVGRILQWNNGCFSLIWKFLK